MFSLVTEWCRMHPTLKHHKMTVARQRLWQTYGGLRDDGNGASSPVFLEITGTGP